MNEPEEVETTDWKCTACGRTNPNTKLDCDCSFRYKHHTFPGPYAP